MTDHGTTPRAPTGKGLVAGRTPKFASARRAGRSRTGSAGAGGAGAAAAGGEDPLLNAGGFDVQWLRLDRHRRVSTIEEAAAATPRAAAGPTPVERAAFKPFVEYEIEVQLFGARSCRVWHRYSAFRDFRAALQAEVRRACAAGAAACFVPAADPDPPAPPSPFAPVPPALLAHSTPR